MTRSTEEIMENFLDLACSLSPENLTCDGESPPEYVQSKLKSIQKSWKTLEQEIGHPMTEDDVWNWEFNKKDKTKNKKNI